MRHQRQHVFTGSPYESRIGMSRAIRVGESIAISGTAPLGPDGKTVGHGDPEAQARRCFEIIRESLEKLGAGLPDVVRTRIYLTDIRNWEPVAKIHGELFHDVRPVTTVVQIVAFVDPDWMIEVEADAVV
ncbi:MAG: RidA family protein [Gammaproteobacteria bacterium]|nr:RidA family protein [Gammaproteobacteria bacterium]MDH5487124.1 RidA family protein [Gammaproteobacteria bacterium]